MGKKEKNKIVRFQRVPDISIGLVVVVFISIYVAFHIFSYITARNVSITEVKQGSIVSNDHLTALALRKEVLIETEESGFLYYYARNGSRVGVRTLIYSLDQSGGIARKLSKKDGAVTDLSEEEKKTLVSEISSFAGSYDSQEFGHVYSFKANLSETIQQVYSREAAAKLSEDIQEASEAGTFKDVYASEPGLLVLSTDGLEGTDLSNYKADSFDSKKLTYKNLRTTEEVKAGSPAYKLITSDDWNLVAPLEDDMVKRLRKVQTIQIRFTEDGAKTWATCELKKKAGKTYLELSLDDSMERYANSRYIGIDLILEENNGLKVPNTSIVSRPFYKISKDYLTEGNGNTRGVIVSGEKGDVFCSVSIYRENESFVWIQGNGLSDSSVIKKQDSSGELMLAGTKDKIPGVYNVNKGYAQFKAVDILFQNEEYSIITPLRTTDLKLYDHIVLKAEEVEEDDIL